MTSNERKDKTGRIQEVELGLKEEEQKALAECRALIQSDADLDDLRDATWARFLRHNSWSVQPAIAQVKKYLAWRKANKIDSILDTPDFANKARIRMMIPYAYHNFDKEGRPIYIERTGMIATAALADPQLCPPDDLMHSHIYGVEMMQRKMQEQSLKTGKRVNGITTILDMEGLGFHHRQCLFVLKSAMEFDQTYYPEYLGKLFVINSPWVAPYIFQAVQLFLDEVTKSRIQIISGNPSEFLLTQIDAENLPVEYGGKCTGVACNHGQSDSNVVKGCIDVLDHSSLKAVEVAGLDVQDVAYDFEKIVTTGDFGENALFTWYFEVQDAMDVDFSVEVLRADGKKETDENKKFYVHKPSRCKTGKGMYKAPHGKAQLLFRWDNNFSWMNSKVIKYMVQCTEDVQGNLEALAASKGVPVEKEEKAQQ